MAATSEYHQLLEIDTQGVRVNTTTFTASGKYLVGGTGKGVQVWRVADGERVATMPVQGGVPCVATSRDGRWIAAGTTRGGVYVWDATTYKQVLADRTGSESIHDVDFSSDSTRLASATSLTATIWNIAAGQRVRTLNHPQAVTAAKYSPQRDQIATAAHKFVQVWDSNINGRLLVDIEVPVRGWRNLLWCKNHFFVLTKDGTIKEIDAATGSTVSEWSVPRAADKTRTAIALPQHGKFIAYSTQKTITFWDTATHTQLGLIPHTHDISSIAFSSDDSLLAIAHMGSRIIVKKLFQSISEPELVIDVAALNAWKRDELTDAEALLSAAVPTSENTANVLASRALVQTRLGQWDAALVDAKESIRIHRSLVGYIAKCMAFVGKGERDKGFHVCDIAFLHFHSEHATFLLLIKIVILFVAGEHINAISRMDDLIADVGLVDPVLYVVQAYMYLLLGEKHMEASDYEHAIQLFEDARIKLGKRTCQPPLMVSLVSGWKFDDLTITIQQHLSEALFAAGRTKEAGECMRRMVDQEINMTEPIKTWVSDFKSLCRGRLEDLGDSAVSARQYEEAISQYTTALSLDLVCPEDLLMKRSNIWVRKGAREDALNDVKEWVRSMLTSCSWKDALTSGVGFMLERFSIYRALCEHLETAGRVTDAIACFYQMFNELAQEMDGEKVNWTREFKSRCCRKLEGLGDKAMSVKQYDTAISQYTVALSLDPPSPENVLLKRSNAFVGKGAQEDALNDAKEWARLMLISGLWKGALATGVDFVLGRFTIHRVVCEHLEVTGRVTDAVACLHQMSSEPPRKRDRELANWTRDFKSRCRSKLEDLGDSAVHAKECDEAISLYTTALSLDPVAPQDLLVKRSNAWARKGAWDDAQNDVKEWTRFMVTSGSWKNALVTDVDFILGKLPIYRAVCEHLEMTGHVTDAIACFHQMSSEPTQGIDGKQANWTRDFKSRCRSKLEDLGDNAVNARQYDEAISQYTAALSLDPPSYDLLVKRSKASVEKGNWNDALNDANEVIKLDSSSPSGYERKYAALLGIGHDEGAIDAFETMLSKMSESSDPVVRERFHHYVRPEQTKRAIRFSINNAIRDLLVVLINALSGRLCDKSEQAAAFESTSAFTQLVTSMTTHIDHAFIEQVVEEFYRYTTFSHTWEGDEPLYEKVAKIVVYDLGASPTHEKLKTFCKIVRDEGFNWAWSDTCCIDKKDPSVLQESLISMFKWYEGSTLTIIFLCDVDELAELGALTESRWNSRGWTLQEYHASKVVRLYTKNWTPYLGLTIHNHKESPEIMSEMEEATGISAKALMGLRPGLNDIREKLRLASTRQTTRVEDAAYSLLGIFSMTLPVTYGEGDKALGRLLSQLLTSSADTSILAWTGIPNSFNSCLPADIIVFSQPLTSHIPPAILDDEMRTITTGLRASPLLDLNLIAGLYNQLIGLSLPFFVGQRMKLPCLTFKIDHVSSSLSGTEHVFRAQAGVLGIVDIKTDQDISRLDSLCLVNPWIDFLLDRQPIGSTPETDDTPSVLSEFPLVPGPSNVTSPVQTRAARLIGRLGRTFGGRPTPDPASLFPPSTMSRMEQRMILQFIARLRCPFGALLLTSTRRNVAEYRRIATESLITVQVEEVTAVTLDELIQGVRVLDVL